MLRRAVADELRANELAPGYVRPAYDDYCFANVPATVASLLNANFGGPTLPTDVFEDVETDIDTVVVVLVDGFGFEQWERHHANHPFLERLTERATVTPLSSTYPSETAAAMTTYHTARTPIEHGLLGWNVYLNAHDAVIESLPFRTKNGADAGEALGADPDTLSEGPSVAAELGRADIQTWRVVPASILPDEQGNLPFTPISYENFDEFATGLRGAVQAAEHGFVHAYLPHIDTAAHEVGTEADDYRAVLSDVSTTIARALSALDCATAERTLLIVTADHGHVDTDPERNVDLLGFDAIREAIRTDRDGTPLFCGGPRNIQLHLRDGTRKRVATTLRDELAHDALVLTPEDALECRLFGPGEPSATFEERFGDLLVVPRERSMWHGGEADELELIGMHGGLHPREMLVPFAAIRAADLFD